jgi:hypothetical protein
VFRLLTAALALTAAACASAEAAGPTTRVDQLLGPYFTLQQGIDAAFSASKIIVAPGIYHECPVVTGLVLLTIVGKKGVVIDATGCDAGLTINDGEGITVKGLTIVGAKQGIVVKPAAERVLLTKTTVQDSGAGVLETGVTVESAHDVTLDKVTVLGAKTRGVQVVSALRTIVRKSTFADGAGAGVVLDNAIGATIVKNTMRNLGSLGIVLFHLGGGGAADSLIQSNTITASAGGIRTAGPDNVVEKNKLTDLTGIGLVASGPGGVSTFRRNTLVRVPGVAIFAPNGGDTFERNRVKDAQGIGIEVVSHGNRFVGNKVSDATGVGVLVDAMASGNVFEGTSVSKSGADGFRVEGTGNTFVKVKASKSGGLDLNDPAAGATTNVYTDCKFKTSSLP